MPVSFVPYDLQEGYVHHWLVAGPQAIAIEDVPAWTEDASRAEFAQRYHEADSGITDLPVEPGPLKESTFTVGDYEGLWAYTPCEDDHFVDLSAFYPSWHFLRAWATTQVTSPDARTITLTLTAYGPADVWLNGAHIYRGETFGLHHDTFEASLRQGANDLLVRFEQVGARACAHRFALRVAGAVEGVQTQIPTAIEDVAHRNRLVAAFAGAYLDRDLFLWDELITVFWPDDMESPEEATVRLQTPTGRIYAESKAVAEPGQSTTLVHAYDAPQGPLRLRFLPRPEVFYEENLRVMREIPVWGLGHQTPSERPYGTPPERRREALEHAMQSSGLFAEIAKMVQGRWDAVELPVVLNAVEAVNRREVDSALTLVGLLGIAARWGDTDGIPASLGSALETCVLGFRGWDDDLEAAPESTQILLHTSEILAGQLYPEQTFVHSGQTGRWHRERGERLALDWLRRRGTGGFAAWDSGASFEAELVALAHLMDLAETEAVWQMVTVVMDKLLFTLALNTHRGVFGATQGAVDLTTLYGGPLAPTAGITRLLWGEGLFNHHLAGLVSVAGMEDYTLPPLIPEIATSDREEVWNRERHVIGAGATVNKVTYRTPDTLLASAQDYRPGQPGTREHVWQATLGPRAVVYTTHPACLRQGEGHAPGFWLGNVTLPRVAQWKDALIAIYRLPAEDWMGFTHAYFPAYAFDAVAARETEQGQAWAFARKGDGYVALTASTGLTWTTRGPGAYRELRSYGRDIVWCCQMGRAALDGDFEAFQEQVLSQTLTFQGTAVAYETLRGATLTFDWEGPLLRDGEEVPLSGFKHYENPYCVADLNAPEMEIRSDNYLMRLKFT